MEQEFTDQLMVDLWALMAHTVFAAEDAIYVEWLPKLRAMKEAPKEERDKIADEYCRAIEIEILRNAEKKETT